ncbi:fumarylacetoacetate hydrolase family protein [Bacillus luteolus]|uniref:Fumarylacetoacetate hydrolase family protein n=1 Tax=Litchfieldia luteola TaxID=682179 RepID=A0ABR9QMG0_9BACI|nr:fumarylacetoacetate hydrolase family protein [Cytobacillus luteolus]MBE4909698.1 fumarylacetoacetate hydrolase family protein [Cytobacillus luteolus]MBP1941262.1 fumarylacetoacetate (FAA) hydrolase [Cytobacillus luteolus]
MKFVTFIKKDGVSRAGWMLGNHHVVDMFETSKGKLPCNMLSFLDKQEEYMDIISSLSEPLESVYALDEVEIVSPLPNPRSFRDFYAFEQHVKTARQNRGLDMIPEWYEIPVFYFSNHMAIKGPNQVITRPSKCEWLDYELEIACVIGKEGTNIKASEVEDYIFGYCILNDWSARDLQRQEMKVGLGPAKGKDFATSIGPVIITKDELESFRTLKGYDLDMTAKVNGELLSKGNFKDIHYSFGEMIERASDGVTLYPGEIIGSGTVGSGCILELGTEVHRWLEPGDEVELEITGLGVLKNRIG